jgi:hypothetical protein
MGSKLSGSSVRPGARLARVAASVAVGLGGLAFAWAVPAAPPAAALTVTPGKVVAWGYNASHQTEVPAEAQSGVTRVAGGCNHSLALKGGKVIGWGDNTFGQVSVPAAAQSGVTAISAGCEHSLALKSNGTIVAWGDDTYGQTDVPPLSAGYKWFAIAAGYHSNVGLASNGTSTALRKWGGGPSVFAGSTGKDVENGQNVYVVLKSDGTVEPHGTTPASMLTPPAGLSNVTALDVGWQHVLALKSNGTVVAWGQNTYGQRSVPAGLSGVTVVAAGGYQSLALKSDGTIVAWGRDDHGEADVPAPTAGWRYSYVAAGIFHSLAILAPGLPGAPTGVTATATDGAALISWQAPASDGGSPITQYTVTSTPGGKKCTTTGALNCSIGGLTNGTGYVFTVKATNVAGTGPASSASTMVYPQAEATAPPPETPTPEAGESASPGASAGGSASVGPSQSPGGGSGGGGGGGTDPLILVLIGGLIGGGVVLVGLTAFLLGRSGRRDKPASAEVAPPTPPPGTPSGPAARKPRPRKAPPGEDSWDDPSPF